MITENDINNAAKDYCNTRYPASQDAPFIAEGFRQGAAWAVKRFPKKKIIRLYMVAVSTASGYGNSLDTVYAFPTEKEREKWMKDVDTNVCDVQYFEDEIEVKLK